MSRKISILVGLLALLFVAAPALAGGWVVITLDSLPTGIQAGQPVEISFMVRHHGQEPTHDVYPILIATNKDTGEKIRLEAEKAQTTGRFIVTANFPSTGTWEWSISAEPFPQQTTLAPITVLESEQVVSPEQDTISAGDSLLWQAILRWGGLSLLAAGLVLIIFDRRRLQKIPSPVSGD